jgi:ribosomal protein S18 acetylase RimI-like enzyme
MTSSPYSVRRAVPEDAPALAQAERDIAKTPGRLVSRPEELRDENFEEKIVSLSKNDSGIYLVIEENKFILGHAFLEPHKLAATSHVVVLTIAVHEGFQGKGLGKILMQHLIEWAQSNSKIEKIELQVRSSNIRAINLYQTLGFIEEGRKTKRLKLGPNEYLDDIYMALWVEK